MVTDYEANTWDWHDNEDERKTDLHFEKVYEFTDFLRTMRRRTQNAVRRLYPRLHDGVSVQEIQQLVGEALYWLAIPDDWAQRFADEFECNEFTSAYYLSAMEHWIEMEVNILRDKGKWELDDDER